MVSRGILQIFEQYQKSRLVFAQSVAELALRPQNNEILRKAGILDLIKPLLTDPCQQIQQCSAVTLGRLVHHDSSLAEVILERHFLPILLSTIENGNKYQKRSVLFVIRAICKENPICANFVINSGGLQILIGCLEDFEVSVKEAAAWGLGYVARHTKELAQTCVDAGAVPLLLLCLQEPELSLKQIATSAIADIAKHSVDLANSVVDAGVVPYLVKNLNNTDEKLKKQILWALCCCAKHTVEIAEVIVEAEIFPSVLLHLAHSCAMVRRNAACLVKEIVKHSVELTQLVVNTGGIGALMEELYQDSAGEETGAKLETITALGFISGHSDQFALSVIGCKAIVILAKILQESEDDTLLSVTALTISQIGKHSPEHAQYVAAANVFPRLLELYMDPNSTEDLKCKCRNCLKLCLQKCLLISALTPLLYNAPPHILKYVLGQYSKILPNDPKARRMFVTSGGLRKVQEIDAQPGTTLYEYITVVNACFPDEIVRYYSPGYPETLLERVEQYSPQMMTVLRESNMDDSEVQTDIPAVIDTSSDDECTKNVPVLI